MRPTDALRAHRRTKEEARIGFEEMCRDEAPPPKPWSMNDKFSRQFALSEHFREILRLASTFYVSSDMMTLLEASWPSIPDGELSDEEYPDQCGFMVYDRPLKDVPVQVDQPRAESVHGYMWVAQGDMVVAYALEPLEDLTDVYWPAGSIWQVPNHESDEVRRLLKPLRATWAFMRQKLAVSVREPADRAERRRCAKLDLPQEVNVVRVRKQVRAHDEVGDPRPVEWSHRWLVSGHWRQQPYGPNREDRRPIWIASHIKGANDLPLVVKDRVTAWVR